MSLPTFGTESSLLEERKKRFCITELRFFSQNENKGAGSRKDPLFHNFPSFIYCAHYLFLEHYTVEFE
jgi:hypothetical protein